MTKSSYCGARTGAAGPFLFPGFLQGIPTADVSSLGNFCTVEASERALVLSRSTSSPEASLLYSAWNIRGHLQVEAMCGRSPRAASGA
jgi:hypothetical protein